MHAANTNREESVIASHMWERIARRWAKDVTLMCACVLVFSIYFALLSLFVELISSHAGIMQKRKRERERKQMTEDNVRQAQFQSSSVSHDLIRYGALNTQHTRWMLSVHNMMWPNNPTYQVQHRTHTHIYVIDVQTHVQHDDIHQITVIFTLPRYFSVEIVSQRCAIPRN